MTLALADTRLARIPVHSRPFRSLPSGPLRLLFLLDAYLGNLHKWEGPAYHRLMGEWLAKGLSGEDDLEKWLIEKLHPLPLCRSRYDRALFQAEDRLRKGMGAAIRSDAPPGGAQTPLEACPRVLYGTGDFSLAFPPASVDLKDRMVEPGSEYNRPWGAVFNSRKPKHFFLHEEWLDALRMSLQHFTAEKIVLAGSIATITYDLVTAWAQATVLPLLLVIPFRLEDFTASRASMLLACDPSYGSIVLTCQTSSVVCAKATRMVCRDRLLALLADFHWILELRSGGNLLTVLKSRQSQQPRPQWILYPKRRGVHNEGNLELLEEWPQWASAFAFEKSAEDRETPSIPVDRSPAEPAVFELAPPNSDPARLLRVPWQDYLYHYTRACPGPWPEQSYRDYLMSLLTGDPLAAHTALDTLIRLLAEGRIRAGTKLVRGDEAVVSLTRVPPPELGTIRRWNPALIRWTFEPYGIAISRKLLRKKGIKPTIYAPDAVYSKLNSDERYRFQRHEPPDCLWKHEREWRLRGDIALADIPDGQGFIFLPEGADLQRLGSAVRSLLPVVFVEKGKGLQGS